MVTAVVVAGGRGERFGSAEGKQLALAAGVPVVTWTLRAFDECASIDAVVLVAHPDQVAEFAAAAVDAQGVRKVVAIVAGGERRQDSVLAGLSAVPAGTEVVAVHDGARPLVTPAVIAEAVDALSGGGLVGVVVGHPVYDTLKDVGAGDVVSDTVDRSRLWVAQTPQVFGLETLRAAYASAEDAGFTGTDDASLVERLGGRVGMVAGPRHNIKVTVAEDIELVEALLAAREEDGS